ncbi:hypothetical protein [Trebonia sp.]|uniref:hypothetical protein n=2 Tax=Trebonia sp. TaxID=2767075 RepID=UPI003CC5174A
MKGVVAIEGNAPEPPTESPPVDDAFGQPALPGAGTDGGSPARRRITRAQVERFIQAVRDSDQALVDDMVLRLSRSRRWLAPLALAVGAFAMLFEGVKLLFTNWRLTLIQVLPAMWIWAAMYDLKAHMLHGKSFHSLTGPAVVIPIVLGIAAITAGSFYLNAVFAFAIVQPGRPAIRPAFAQARSHLAVVLGSGAVAGILLGLSTVVVVRWGVFWFGLTLSAVIGVMMLCYVAVPTRLIGMKTTHSRRDKLAASAVGGAIGAVVCTPPYVLGRVGLLMLGSTTLFILGTIVFAVGLTLQAGATGAVKTIKMSAKLISGRNLVPGQTPSENAPGQRT